MEPGPKVPERRRGRRERRTERRARAGAVTEGRRRGASEAEGCGRLRGGRGTRVPGYAAARAPRAHTMHRERFRRVRLRRAPEPRRRLSQTGAWTAAEGADDAERLRAYRARKAAELADPQRLREDVRELR